MLSLFESISQDTSPYWTLFLLFLVSLASFFVVRRVLIQIILLATKDIQNIWVQALLGPKFLFRSGWLTPIIIFYIGLNLLPEDWETQVVVLQRTSLILFTFFGARTLTALIDSITKSYSSLAMAKNKPIKGMMQVLSMIIYLASFILIISVIINKSPWVFLSGLGAMTAILMLVFKDTILSFVAGIQITTNDFIRVGDWIEAPQFGADGDVVDIALHAVKVQNWDKTVTIIPTHKFLENSYKNWRGMQESGGRRIKRSIFIDMDTVRFLSDEEIEKFKTFHLLSDYIQKKQGELSTVNQELYIKNSSLVNMRRLTNLGTFRAYIQSYLKSSARLHPTMTQMVRQLAPTPEGLPLEIYTFTNTIVWTEYEGIQSDIFDHILAIAPEFGLRVFQSPSSASFASLKNS